MLLLLPESMPSRAADSKKAHNNDRVSSSDDFVPSFENVTGPVIVITGYCGYAFGLPISCM